MAEKNDAVEAEKAPKKAAAPKAAAEKNKLGPIVAP